MKDTISIVVADDHPLFREGVVKTLSNEASLHVVAEAENAGDVIELVVDHLPNIALLDINMPGDGLHTARQIALRCPVVRVVMLTVAEDEYIVNAALRAGALGYISKGVSGPELVRVVNAVHQGEAYITPSLATSLLRSMPAPLDAADPLAPLDRARSRHFGTPRGRG